MAFSTGFLEEIIYMIIEQSKKPSQEKLQPTDGCVVHIADPHQQPESTSAAL